MKIAVRPNRALVYIFIGKMTHRLKTIPSAPFCLAAVALWTGWVAISRAPAAPESVRLVSTSPQLTELLFQLGKGGDIVATPAFSFYPDAAKNIPLLGPLFFPGIEQTLRVKPTTVLLDGPLELYRAFLKNSDIATLSVDLTSPRQTIHQARELLSRLYAEKSSVPLDEAASCLAAMEHSLTGQTFLAFVWLDPPVLFGTNSFLSRLLEGMGAINAAPPSLNPYPAVSPEWILREKVTALYWMTSFPDAEATLQKKISQWWPERRIRGHVLSEDDFARASLRPILQIPIALSLKGRPKCALDRKDRR